MTPLIEEQQANWDRYFAEEKVEAARLAENWKRERERRDNDAWVTKMLGA